MTAGAAEKNQAPQRETERRRTYIGRALINAQMFCLWNLCIDAISVDMHNIGSIRKPLTKCLESKYKCKYGHAQFICEKLNTLSDTQKDNDNDGGKNGLAHEKNDAEQPACIEKLMTNKSDKTKNASDDMEMCNITNGNNNNVNGTKHRVQRRRFALIWFSLRERWNEGR